jgi:hypothetical protein
VGSVQATAHFLYFQAICSSFSSCAINSGIDRIDGQNIKAI